MERQGGIILRAASGGEVTLMPVAVQVDNAGRDKVARGIFWFAQLIGIITSLFLILFIGGNLIGELIAQDITLREDYSIFLFFFCEVLIAVAIIISWYRKRLGPVLMLVFSILVALVWGRENLSFILLHLPLLFSGLLLLFYSFYKEWVLKQRA